MWTKGITTQVSPGREAFVSMVNEGAGAGMPLATCKHFPLILTVKTPSTHENAEAR